jgi:drug/metabolite transporter (DMT)-like permease
MVNLALYALIVSIWGSTWLAITFQLGVPVATAIGWRFLLASLLLLGWCRARRVALRFDRHQWALAIGQGLLNYGVSYWLVYEAEARLSSGLVAVIFSLLMVFNMIGGSLFFGQRITLRVAAGAVLGVLGVALVFWPELAGFGKGGILLALGGTLLTAGGNLLAMRAHRSGIGLIPGMAVGMGAAGLALLAYAGLSGQSMAIPLTARFLLPLLYLSLFGSVIGFAAYLGLIERVGAAPASYANVLTPIVALALSSLFEGYQWRIFAVAGLLVSLLGNLLVMSGKMRAAS